MKMYFHKIFHCSLTIVDKKVYDRNHFMTAQTFKTKTLIKKTTRKVLMAQAKYKFSIPSYHLSFCLINSLNKIMK